jgi:CBS domain-containing protein
MSRAPVTIPAGSPPEAALDLMRRSDLRHLPVCSEEGRLVGLLGLGDVMPPT